MSSNCDYFNGTNDVKFLMTKSSTMSNTNNKSSDSVLCGIMAAERREAAVVLIYKLLAYPDVTTPELRSELYNDLKTTEP